MLWFLGDQAGLNGVGVAACAGDVDRDGYGDLILGAYQSQWGTWGYVPGGAVVRSGRDGRALFTFRGQYPLDIWLGYSVDGGADVNGDGYPDFLIGTAGGVGGVGLVYVYSGKDGSLIRVHTAPTAGGFGSSVSYVGDVDGDAFEDYIVGARSEDPGGVPFAGAAYLCSAGTGALLFSWHGTTYAEDFGYSVDGVADVDGDGFPDVCVGAPAADPGGRTNAGQAWVFSGRDGALIRVFEGGGPYDHLGISVARVGDLNRDGYPELAVGAPNEDTPSHWDAGALYVFSGADGSLLWKATGRSRDEQLGRWVAGAGDQDDDGIPEVLGGAPQYDMGTWPQMVGRAYVFSGRDGRILHVFQGDRDNLQVGGGVADAGDVNGDGRREILIGLAGWPGYVPDVSFSGRGAVAVYSFNSILSLSAPTILASGGQPVEAVLDFDVEEAGRGYALLASGHGVGPARIGGLEVPLTRDTLLDAMLAGWSPPMLVNGTGTLDQNGAAAAQVLSHRSLRQWVGRTFWLAAVSYDPVQMRARISSVPRGLTVAP